MKIMTAIQPGELPRTALLNRYKQEGAYTDCYFMDMSHSVSQAEYVEAFYATGVFRIERLLLSWFASKPSTDYQVKQLASGEAQMFSAWRVEDRTPDQLLLCDFMGRTRSWLMSVPKESGDSTGTRLYFGSAVVPSIDSVSGRQSFGFAFHALQGFHRLYSRTLMMAARSRLLQSRDNNRSSR